MATLTERVRAAWSAFQRNGTTPATPARVAAPLGEFAFMDPRRLFPGGITTQYNPSWLVGRRGLQIFDQMRRDDQVKAALAFKKHTILASGWTVTSPQGESDDWEVTAFVRWVFAHLGHGEIVGTMEQDLLEVLSGLDYGYSITEKLWAPVADGPFSGLLGLSALKTRQPRDFNFDQDPFGNLLPDGLIQQGNTVLPGGRLPVHKFVLYVHDPLFGNYYGTSDLEAAYRAYWLKDNAYKWLAMLLESLGIPPIFGLYQPGRYTEAQQTELKKIFRDLQARTFGILPRPDPQALEFWAPELAGQAPRVFLPALDMLNKDISRAILMPGLLGMTPDLATGSYARAKVQFDVFLEVVEHIRRTLREVVVQHQIIQPLVDLNFPGVEHYPVFEFMPISDEVRLDILDRWAVLVAANIVTTQDPDETHVRKMLRFPERQPGSERRPPTPPAPPEEADGRPVAFAQRVRPPDRLERHVDFAQIAASLDRAEALARLQFIGALEEARDVLMRDAEAILIRGQGVEYLTLLGAAAFPGIAANFLRATYDAGVAAVRREVPARFQETGVGFLPDAALRFLSAKAVRISGVLSDRLLADAKQVLLNALKVGEPQRETLAKLEAVFEPYLGDETVLRDGDVIEPFRLETILRTNATEAFNQGRLVTARGIAAGLHGMRYSAVIDARTTPVCRHLDGRLIPMSEPELDRLSPPNHFQCRAILVPVPIDVQVPESEFITPSQVGRAKELIQAGFK
jgi:SPP1 gp7 family putative phage head morphogenesis protein